MIEKLEGLSDVKFRAWHVHQKFMFKVGAIQFSGRPFVVQEGSLYTCELNEVKLMQYIGMRDKNIKEIYKSDIVRVTLFGNEVHEVEVEYIGCSYIVMINQIKVSLDSFSPARLEVISNIYEGVKDE